METIRPSWMTGAVVGPPDGSSWDFTLSGPQDSAREDVYPASNFMGGTAFAALAEPGSMIPTTDGFFVEPPTEALPTLAEIYRKILRGE